MLDNKGKNHQWWGKKESCAFSNTRNFDFRHAPDLHFDALLGLLSDLVGVEDGVGNVGNVAHNDAQGDGWRQKPQAQHQTHQNFQLIVKGEKEWQINWNCGNWSRTRTAGFIRCDYLVGSCCSFFVVEWTDGPTFWCHWWIVLDCVLVHVKFRRHWGIGNVVFRRSKITPEGRTNRRTDGHDLL